MSAKHTSLEIVEPAPSAKAENLTAIANDITATHAAAKSHAQLAVVFAIRTGSLCEQAKAALPHGKFGEWLEKNCPDISDRTARNYIALLAAAKNETVSLLGNGSKSETVSVLPLAELTGPDFLSKIEGDAKYRESVTAKVRDVLGEGSLTDLYKDYGVIHAPRNVDAATGKRVHYEPKKTKLSPDQVAKQNRAAAKALFIRALGDFKAALDDKHARRWLEPKDWTDLRKVARDRMKQLDAIADKAEAAAAKGHSTGSGQGGKKS